MCIRLSIFHFNTKNTSIKHGERRLKTAIKLDNRNSPSTPIHIHVRGAGRSAPREPTYKLPARHSESAERCLSRLFLSVNNNTSRSHRRAGREPLPAARAATGLKAGRPQLSGVKRVAHPLSAPPRRAGRGWWRRRGRPVEGVSPRGERRDYHSFLCSSMETPPGPMETSISRPPTTDSVWRGDHIHQVRKTNTNNRTNTNTNSAALRKDIRLTIYYPNNSVAGQNQSGNRPTMSFRCRNKDVSYARDSGQGAAADRYQHGYPTSALST